MQTIQDMIEHSMCNYREKTAIIKGDISISYRELERRASGVAKYLADYGVLQGRSIVGILMQDTVDIIVAILGILKVRCVFVPIDIHYPVKRIQRYLDHISCKLIITDHNMFFTELDGVVRVKIDDITLSPEEDCSLSKKPSYNPEDPIYVYFTSGTSQEPKAILGKNVGLAHFVQWEIKELMLDNYVRVSQLTPPMHDPFLRDIFVPLAVGGTVCLTESPVNLLSPSSLVQYLNNQEIELVHITPSLFRLMAVQAIVSQASLISLKYVCLAGEAIHPSDLIQWYQTYGDRIKLMNLYGPTETALAKLYYWIKPEDLSKNCIPVGQPIENTAVVILDDSLSVCAPGQLGELYIRTKYGTHGYINAPLLMEKVFVKNPLTNLLDDIVYKTGDLARYDSQMNIELAGRKDRQIKLRGFRVELDEIEGVLRGYPNIENAAVVAFNHDSEMSLAVFYVSNIQINSECQNENADMPELIKKYMLSMLPEYMCPVHFIKLDNIPLTHNRKTDYKALSSMIIIDAETQVSDQPNSKIEKILCQMWCELLNMKSVGIHDNFMQLGGNSLTIMQFVYQVYKEFQVDLPLGIVFEYPTVEDQAIYIEKHIRKSGCDNVLTEQNCIYRVSPAQARIYISHMYEECDTSYNLPAVMIIHGKLDIDRLESCCSKLVEKHTSLRTSFYIKDNQILQEVQQVDFHIEKKNMPLDELDEYIIRDFVRPFVLCKPPLLRVAIVKLGIEHYAFLFDTHHIVSDGISQRVLIEDLISLYQGKEVASAEWSYNDYVSWVLDERQIVGRERHMQYWLKQFSIPSQPLTLPYNVDVTQQPNIGSYVAVKISPVLYNVLQKTARDCASTLFTVMLGAFFVFLNQISGIDNITVGVPVHGRNHPNLKRIVGMFVQMLPVGFHIGKYTTTRELINSLKKYFQDIFSHMDFDMDMFVSALNKAGLNRPQIDAVFVMQNTEELPLLDTGVDIQPYPIKLKSVRNKLVMEVIENKNSLLDIHLEYQFRYFDEETVSQFLQHYVEVLDSLFSNLDSQLKP